MVALVRGASVRARASVVEPRQIPVNLSQVLRSAPLEIRMDGIGWPSSPVAARALGYAMGSEVCGIRGRRSPSPLELRRMRSYASGWSRSPQATGQKRQWLRSCDVADAEDINTPAPPCRSCNGLRIASISWSTTPASQKPAPSRPSFPMRSGSTILDLKLMAAVQASAAWSCRRMKEPTAGARIINMLNTLAKTPAKGSAPTSVTRAAGMALTKVLSRRGRRA